MTTSKMAKILLVDDEPKNLVALQALLEGPDREIVAVTSGADALRHLLREDFALIILDVHMPGMGGFETAELIRQRERSRGTPILFITAAVRGEFAVSTAYSLGAVDYLLRPVDTDILRFKVDVFVELFKKTAEVQRQADELADARAFLTSVLHAATEHAIVAFGKDGLVQVWNTGAQRIYGRAAAEMLGRPVADLFEEDVSGRLDEILTRVLAEDRVEGEMLHRRADGSLFPARCAINARTDDVNGRPGFVLVSQDITALKLAEEAQAEVAALRRSNAMKDEFLGLVSHELRTPLTTVVGNAHSLRNRFQSLPPDQMAAALDDISNNAQRLHVMIESMLLLSRLDGGQLPDMEPVLLQRLVPRIVDDFCAQNRTASIQVQVSADLPPVNAHADYLSQVLLNLLTNALKYAPEGAPVSVCLEHDYEDVRVSVLDAGPGISEDESEIVFRPFTRLEKTRFRAAGAGLGLAVCKRLMAAMGGTIGASPRQGGGSAFFFTLKPIPVSADALDAGAGTA